MPTVRYGAFDQLSPAAKQRINTVCADYEKQWKNGAPPDLVAALADSPHEERPALLAELLRIDIECRERCGERLRLSDYLRRLPAYEVVVQSVYDDLHPALATQTGRGTNQSLTPTASRAADPLPNIPGYAIDGILGRGGMGVVYNARQSSLGRRVAIKMVLAGELAAPEDRVRFLTEAETIARLRHPNIVQIFEVSEHEGRLFFALEHVEGGSLRQKLQGTPLPPRDAAALVEKLARAVNYAHQQGIVHRDLTPGNILLAADGEPKITDFGLAKHLTGAANLTVTGMVMGTPQYMSPEQARGETKTVGPPADIYALGAVLYEALAGRPPFVGANPMEVIRQVTADEPMPLTRLNRGVPTDLGTICMKCLEKEPGRRYATAAALAGDLRHFLDGEPIAARRVSEWERAWKWARRRPLVAGSLATAALALLAGSVVSTYFAFQADARRRDAERASVAADKGREEAERATRQVLDEQTETRRREALLLFQNAVTMAEAKGQVTPALHTMLAAARAAPPGDEAFDRVVRTNFAAWLPQVPELRLMLDEPPRNSREIIVGPGGKWLATITSEDGPHICLWDTDTAELRHTFKVSTTISEFRCTFHPEGRLFGVVPVNREDNTIKDSLLLYDVAEGRPQTVVLDGATINAIRFSRDGKTLFAAAESKDGKGLVYRMDVASLKPERPAAPVKQTPLSDPWPFDGPCLALESSPDGQRLAIAHDGAPVRAGQKDRAATYFKHISLVDASTGKPIGKAFGYRGDYLVAGWAEFHPDSSKVLIKDFEGVHFVNAETGELVRDVATNSYSLQFHPGGQLFMRIGGYVSRKRADQETSCWDGINGLPRGEASFQSLAKLTPDGDGLLTESGRNIYLWRRGQVPCRAAEGLMSLDAKLPRHVAQQRGNLVHDFALMSDDREVLASPFDKAIFAFDPVSGRPFGQPIPIRLAGSTVGNIAMRPGGAQYAVNQGNGVVALYDAKSGRSLGPALAAVQSYIWSLAYSPDGNLLAVGHNGPIALWDVTDTSRNGPRLRSLLPLDDAPGRLVFSPDGRRLAACVYPDWKQKPGLQLWDPATGRPVGPYHRTDYLPQTVFTPDSKTLAFVDGTRVRRLETATGNEIGSPLVFPHGINAVAFTPDGARFLTGGGDGVIQMWDTASGERIAGASFVTWMGVGVVDLVVHPDGRQVLAVLANNTIQRWDVESRPPLPLGPAIVLRWNPGVVTFTHDGRSIITQTTDGNVRVWPIATPIAGDLKLLERQLEVRTGLEWNQALGRPAALDREEWLKRKSALAVKLPSPPSDDEELAHDAEQDGNTFAARWHLDRLIAANPQDPMLYLRRGHNAVVAAGTEGAGNAARREQHLRRAIEDFDKAAASGAADFLADWYSHRSFDCESSGWEDLAFWYLDRALALAPKDPRLHAVKAWHLQRFGKVDESLAEWAVAADAQPDEWIWRLWRSEFQQRLGRNAEAEADVLQAIVDGATFYMPRLSVELGQAGQWARLAELFAKIRDKRPMPIAYWQIWALCNLAMPDPDGYRRVCQRLNRPGLPADALQPAIWITTRGPDGLADWQSLLAQAEALTKPPPEKPNERHQWLSLTGALLYRAGKFAEATDRLTEALAVGGQGGTMVDWLFLAMVQQRLGHGEEARRWLTKARESRAKLGGAFDWNAVEVDVLLREAERAIESASPR